MTGDFKAALSFVHATYAALGSHPAVQVLNRAVPELAPESVIEVMAHAYQQKQRRLLFHVSALIHKAHEVVRGRDVNSEEFALALLAILYHDSAKVIEPKISGSLLGKVVSTETYGHSMAIRRLFLYLDLPELAQAVRHQSTDFILDIRQGRVSIPQLILNIVDRLDESGGSVTPEQKLANVRAKLGGNTGFDGNSEAVACHIVREILHFSGPFASLGFLAVDRLPRRSVLFTQRFDGKYCAPVGPYRDTSSNLAIAKHLARWGWRTTLLHEGDFGEVEYDGGATRLIGIQPVNDGQVTYQSIIEHIGRHEAIVVEGWTTALAHLRAFVPREKPLILLLRTMSQGRIEDGRLDKIGYADQIWVMTEEMRSIIGDQLAAQDQSIQILQSGIDEQTFFVDPSRPRQRGKIVYVGAVTPLKGVDTLLEAFEQVKSIHPEVELHVIGAPSIYGRVNSFELERLAVYPDVYCHGVLEAPGIANHLQSAHVAVLLTKIYETWGKSAAQARCCGARMLVSASGALPFHVQSSDEGIVLSAINKESVAHALLQLLSYEPGSVPPPVGRYHPWVLTAINLVTYLDLLERVKQRGLSNNI